ncbi:MAG: NRDE family protein, partial [Deltaproteobacteria bacterium]|nr:NRDE family protein [Deltaproteobacteria bacterium]
FLCGNEAPVEYIQSMRQVSDKYNGFNLILGDRDGFFCFSNAGEGFHEISPGVHGLSNHLLDTPWPKVKQGRKLLSSLISKRPKILHPMKYSIYSQTPPDLTTGTFRIQE